MKEILRVGVLGGLFVIPFLAIYVANDYFFPFITGKNFWFRIIVDVVLAGWVVLALLDAQYRPRWSWLLGSFVALIGVMFFANWFGVHPPTSFLSNFERMDGYITLVHVFLYFLVLGSMLTSKTLWQYYLHTTLVVAFFVALYGLSQAAGIAQAPGGGRIDSWLGNAAYLAIYMLFHIFIAFWLFVESRKPLRRVVYGALALMFVYALLETGTRGTFIGFVTGTGAMVVYIALFGTRYKEFRTYALAALGVLVLLVGGLFLARDTDFVQNNPNLSRFANIDLGEDLRVRGTIWGMAWQGVQERPLLGYGQGNFNYVFNTYYDPFLFNQEQWFDRVHNIFFDWLIAGGVFGLMAYLSIFIAAVYYLFLRPLLRPSDESFTVLERGVLLGILVGYFTHNLVVFDNIISYIFFAMILAIIHSRVATPIAALQHARVPAPIVAQLVAPAATAAVVAVVYLVHLPGMAAATSLIDGFRAPTPEASLAAFEETLAIGSFAKQEIIEQLAQRAMNIQMSEASPEAKQAWRDRAEAELNNLVAFKPNDARVHVFFGSFYRAFGELDKAAEQLAIARTLSPKKQSIIEQQGVVALTQQNYQAARDFFAEGFALDERNVRIREFLVLPLLYLGDMEAIAALMTDDTVRDQFAQSDLIVSTANQTGSTDFLLELFERRVALGPENAQAWATLAFLYYQAGRSDEAITTLAAGAEAVPAFASSSQCISENIRAGRDPQEGC
jgi:O-antigen ligase/Flp pilus assembly protein TadD